MKTVLLVLADGFEETEALGAADVLRRLGCEVTLASLTGEKVVTGAHRMKVIADTAFEPDKTDFDAIFLPGGMPGAKSLYESDSLCRTVGAFARSGKVVSAICAAPIVLAKCGLLHDKAFTMYPGFEAYLNGLCATGRAAESDGKIITGCGPGAVFAFAAKLAEALDLGTKIPELYSGMFVEL